MSVGKVTTIADIIDAKSPTALRVAFKKNAGNLTAVNISTLNANDYITKQMFADNVPVVSTPITQAIPTNTNGFYDYDYDGSLGDNPTAYIQLQVSSPSAGWVKFADAIILDNGHLYALADFSTDTYRLIIKV